VTDETPKVVNAWHRQGCFLLFVWYNSVCRHQKRFPRQVYKRLLLAFAPTKKSSISLIVPVIYLIVSRSGYVSSRAPLALAVIPLQQRMQMCLILGRWIEECAPPPRRRCARVTETRVVAPRVTETRVKKVKRWMDQKSKILREHKKASRPTTAKERGRKDCSSVATTSCVLGDYSFAWL